MASANDNAQQQQTLQIPFGGWIQAALAIADRYGPTGILTMTLLVGMWYTTSWLRDESMRNDQNNQVLTAKFTEAIRQQQEHYDRMLDREHKEFKESLSTITKTFNDVMLKRGGAGQ